MIFYTLFSEVVVYKKGFIMFNGKLKAYAEKLKKKGNEKIVSIEKDAIETYLKEKIPEVRRIVLYGLAVYGTSELISHIAGAYRFKYNIAKLDGFTKGYENGQMSMAKLNSISNGTSEPKYNKF